ncbi:MAG: biopolymer transporter ExbD [Candidatus Aminicenantes bacterium]|nr:biopolymer transporter ExbD [Candidatus Aminicenantes bacterium]
MSISISTGKQPVQASPNVVPLCDVLLVLLIIFMLVTPLVQRGVDLTLPTAINSVSMPESPKVVLYIRKDGTLFLNQDKLTIDRLPSKLEEAFLSSEDDKRLYLRADGEIAYGKLLELYETIRVAGYENIAIITDKKTDRS